MARDPYTQVGGSKSGYKDREHRVIAARALGRPLPPGVEVHHHDDGDRRQNDGTLVICPNRAYHKLLESRTRALRECGNPDWRPCNFCHRHDDPTNMKILPRRGKSDRIFHRACSNRARAGRAKRARAQS